MSLFHRQKENSHHIVANLPQTEHICIGLSLDTEAKQEHVVLGEFDDIRLYLGGNKPAMEKLLANEVRPFGTFLKPNSFFYTRVYTIFTLYIKK